MTHYEVLGVAAASSTADIRAAYHRQARRWHPDFAAANGVDAARARREMQRVNEAWRVLSDPNRRRSYDAEIAPPEPTEPIDVPSDEEWWAERERWVPAEGAVPRRPMVIAPVGLFATGVVLLLLNAVIALPVVFLVAIGFIAASGVLFVIAPFLSMVAAKRESDI